MNDTEKQGALNVYVTLIDTLLGASGLPPVASGLSGLRQMVQASSSSILEEKIEAFFESYSKIPPEQAKDLLGKLHKNEPKFMKVVFDIINRINDVKKSKILGLLFEAALKGEVLPSEFIELSFMVDQIYSRKLNDLYSWFREVRENKLVITPSEIKDQRLLNELATVGFIIPKARLNNAGVSNAENYELTDLGKKFMKNALTLYFDNIKK